MHQITMDDLLMQESVGNIPGRTAFIDESGNFGFDFTTEGASRFYILCAVVVEDGQINALHSEIGRIKATYFQNGEMKSNKIKGYARRNTIIAELLPINFRVILLVADKQAFIDGSPLKEYKASFIKYIHQRLYTMLYQAYPKLKISEDEYGNSEFQEMFMKYVEQRRPQENLFNEYDFDYCNSRDSVLIQLADVVGGTIAKCYTDPGAPNYVETLRGKIIQLEEFPGKHEPYWGTNNEAKSHYSKEVFTLALKLADDFINKNEQDGFHEKRLQVAFLKYVKLQVLNDNPARFVPSHEILSVLETYTNSRISRDYLFRRIIAPLRDDGVILSSCSRGYKLPISVADITAYVNQTHTVVAPMLHRIDVCRKLIRQATGSGYDILDDPAFIRYKHYFDA